MNGTPRANRLHIGIFGRRNVGKSSLINALTGQEAALVADNPGTTTDPVFKSMELLPLGPCVLIDTAGIDDEGSLGNLRIKKTREIIEITDLAILVIDPLQGISQWEQDLLGQLRTRDIPVVAVLNKADLTPFPIDELEEVLGIPLLPVSALSQTGMVKLKETIIAQAPRHYQNKAIVGDIIKPKDLCILVTPIDSAAPAGRMILPQVQTIRDILDHNGQALVVKETELKEALASLTHPPRLVITDSQVFAQVSSMVTPDIPLTSFSILFARYKGDLKTLIKGVEAVKQLKPGDKVLIAEACTHHRQEDDIGTVKIPRLLQQRVGGKLQINTCSGSSYPDDLSSYKLIIHCGACMINRRQMLSRIKKACDAGVPIVNYGVLLAYLNGILDRTLAPFREELSSSTNGKIGDD